MLVITHSYEYINDQKENKKEHIIFKRIMKKYNKISRFYLKKKKSFYLIFWGVNSKVGIGLVGFPKAER